jgi:hypothetical protein
MMLKKLTKIQAIGSFVVIARKQQLPAKTNAARVPTSLSDHEPNRKTVMCSESTDGVVGECSAGFDTTCCLRLPLIADWHAVDDRDSAFSDHCTHSVGRDSEDPSCRRNGNESAKVRTHGVTQPAKGFHPRTDLMDMPWVHLVNSLLIFRIPRCTGFTELADDFRYPALSTAFG